MNYFLKPHLEKIKYFFLLTEQNGGLKLFISFLPNILYALLKQAYSHNSRRTSFYGTAMINSYLCTFMIAEMYKWRKLI